MTRSAISQAFPLRSVFVAALAFACGVAAPAQVNVLTQHNDNARDGVNAAESTLTPSNVNSSQFGLLLKLAVDDQVYAQPLVLSNVSIGGGTHTVVFVATTNNSVYAFDAVSGTLYWHVNFGTPITKATGGFTCDDTLGTSGIMSTPVIDAAKNTIYVVAETFINSVAQHKLHALSTATGAEQANSPVVIQATGFNSATSVQRTGLLEANGNIYFAFASHCDQGTYKGLTFGYNAATLASAGIFDASPDDNGAGIWHGGNGLAADAAGSIYLITGNGAWDGQNDFSESFIKTTPGLTLSDWHTPSDYHSLDSEDKDLTSSGPLLMGKTGLVVAGGKDGILRVVNTAKMGHLGDATAVQNWQATSSHIHSMVYYADKLYEWGQSDYLRVFRFTGSTFTTKPWYTGNVQAIGHPGASLSLSSSGESNGILWAYTNSQGDSGGLGAWHTTEPGILYAYAAPAMTPLWNNEINAKRDDCANYAKFTPPTIANGRVYLASFGTAQTGSGQLCIYGELGQQTAIADGTYIITSANSGDAIDDPGYSKTAGEVMVQYPVNKQTNQQWKLHNLGNNVVTLTNVSSAMAMEVSDGSVANSALVDQNSYNGNDWQQWNVIPVGGGAYELTNVDSGLALDVDGGKTNAREQIDQYTYRGNAWQQWKFTAAK